MSLLARLTELRARRVARALLEIQQGIDDCVLDPGKCDETQFERLCVLRELAMMQVEQLSRRVRRDRTLRGALEAVCRAYQSWADEEPGTEREPECADELATRIVELRDTIDRAEAAERPPETAAPVVIASLRR
ncbi:hypothetical protein [Sandaracinus amylolyticus]|uniref:hypothetical protein n=1 Tax=Sandaracinus amylolyticus TaxID=927083 RepID=UPI001F33AFBB|nr:hypothetical protein [Sandaracinus amylolyticus]UJR81165.1 Hypothetical protein I5071_32180 [Sandaracinus amylolyticus]